MLPAHWSGLDRALPLLLDAGAKGAVVLALAAAIAFLLRRRSAAARHAVWTFALGAQLALPVLALVLPAWRVARPEWVPSARGHQPSAAAAAPTAPAGEYPRRSARSPR